MERNKFVKIWTTFSSIVLLLGAIWIWISTTSLGIASQDNIAAPQVGFSAPDFQLSTFNGDVYTLSKKQGQPLLINFWASWCPPCRSEMLAIQRMYDEYREQGFTVLAVNSTYQDNLGDAITFAQNQKLTFPILLDREGVVSNLYELRSLPTSIFVDSLGIIQEVVTGGSMSESLLRIRIERLLQNQH